jgi:predicted RecA/RadA family phage recombinase
MAEANTYAEGETIDYTPTTAITAGEVVQLHDGRAAYAHGAIAANVKGAVQVCGLVEVAKTTTMVVLPGTKLYWDASANKAHILHRNDADFELGIAADDAASADTTVIVHLNARRVDTLSLASGYASIPISTAGWPHIYGGGNSVGMKFDLTAEAQKVDALSIRAMATATPAIVDALICVNLNGDDAAFDLNVGLADDTHATDADTIVSSLFAHFNGNDLNIYLESDNAAAEVAATDSTIDFVVGTPFLVQFDLRDWADIQIYINGVLALPNSTFTLAGVAGPLKLLAHMEKTANDSPGNVAVMDLCARTFTQAAAQ